jgi:hypothetical protein
MRKVHIIIPAIGDSHFVEKVGILDRNLTNIKQYPESADIELSIRIFLYTPNILYLNMLLEVVTQHIPIEKIIIHEEPGYLGEFIYRYIQPSLLIDYDYLLFLLDDVELSENFYLDRWIQCYHQHRLDILSPTILRHCQSHQVMKQPEWADHRRGSEISIVNMCEFFSYFMTPAIYYRYYNMYNENTKTMWGIDLAMYHAGFRMGLHNKVTLNHYFSGSLNSNRCGWEMGNFLKNRQHITVPQQKVLHYEPCNLFYFMEDIEKI